MSGENNRTWLARQELVDLIYHVRRQSPNPFGQLIGQHGVFRRQACRIDHHARIGHAGEPEQFLGLIPDNVEIAGDALEELECRLAAMAVLERRKIGRRHADRLGERPLGDALALAQFAHRLAERRHGADAPGLSKRASRT